MASTIILYEGDGTRTDFTIPFDYLKKSFVTVRLGTGTTLTGGDYGDTGSDYYFLDKTTIRLKVAPAPGESLTIRRYTSATERVVTFKGASILKATDLDTSQVQAFHIAEEGRDILEDSLAINREGNWDAKNKRIVNLADPIDPQDAMTKAFYDADSQKVQSNRDETEKFMQRAEAATDNAEASEVNSKNSEVKAKASEDTAVSAALTAENLRSETQAFKENAEVSATNANLFKTSAKASEVASKKSEENSKTSENNAKTSEVNAKESEVNAKESEVNSKKSEDYVRDTAGVVVPIASDIKVVATNIEHVKTTSTNIKDVNLVGGDLEGSLSISTFLDYGDLGDTSGTIPTITGGNIKVVADNIEDVRTVAGLTDDFQTVINSVETVTSLTTRAEAAATTATTKSTEASNSATAAATSATTAKASETAANASETNAASSATKAASSAASASTSATNASDSATAAATSATTAGISATNAGASADSAEASATEATTQAERAKEYAAQASAGQIQADWLETDNTAKSFIKNKPSVNTYNVVLAELQEGTKTTFGYVTAAGIRGAIKKWAPTDVGISGKADITYVDEQVATKLDVTTFNSYVDYGDLGDL